MHMKSIVVGVSSALSLAALAADEVAPNPLDPQVSNVRMEQDDRHIVTVKYDLDADAIITFDVMTNGVSIGGENVRFVTGDANRLVQAGLNRELRWNAARSWPGRRFDTPVVSVRVSAWAKDMPPDYMVVDLTASKKVTYYTAPEFLPGGLLSNDLYYTSAIVMRHIPAGGVEWQMGTATEPGRAGYMCDGKEAAHMVTLDSDYYMAVFPITQGQWSRYKDNTAFFTVDGTKRMMEHVHFGDIRGADAASYYPEPPHAESFLGKLRAHTSIDFDLPGEAQWEFACRAGTQEGYWNDGSPITLTASSGNYDNNVPGRYKYKDGWTYSGSGDVKMQASYIAPTAASDPSAGSPIPGRYGCNAFGLYDMHGGVYEACLDWVDGDITELNGRINANGAQTLKGVNGSSHVSRGGSWQEYAYLCRSSSRAGTFSSATRYENCGFRVMCPYPAVK